MMEDNLDDLICEWIKDAAGLLRELQQYRDIGTLEECKTAVESRRAKKPVAGADILIGYDDNGESVWETDYACPECGMGIHGEYVCCPYCRQEIDWSGENERM